MKKSFKRLISAISGLVMLSTCICAIPTSAEINITAEKNVDVNYNLPYLVSYDLLPDGEVVNEVYNGYETTVDYKIKNLTYDTLKQLCNSEDKILTINGEQFKFTGYSDGEEDIGTATGGFRWVPIIVFHFTKLDTVIDEYGNEWRSDYDMTYYVNNDDNLNETLTLHGDATVNMNISPAPPKEGVPDIFKDTTVGDSSSTIGDSSTVGDSDVLPSEPTGIRGDVNYDGKVNVADIITLRRYLLHIIEW